MIVLLLFPILLFGQSKQTTISGFIYDDANGEALIGANVFIEGLPIGSSTNHSGYYVIPEVPSDMFFRDYGTNGFVRADRDHLSTFAADVDDASYTLARKYITEGFMPPADAIRIEEFVNHFQYGYKPPEHKKFQIFLNSNK